MRFLKINSCLLIAACLTVAVARARLEIITDNGPQSVFFGEAKMVPATFHNPSQRMITADIHARLFQSAFATAVQLADFPWKKLEVLAHQTVLESAQFNFPAVRAKTTFVIQWLDSSNFVLGKTTVQVYPNNLLQELKIMMDDNDANLGLLDPDNRIKSVLEISGIHFVDLEQAKLDDFSGKLVIVGSCTPSDTEWHGLAERISAVAKKGTPVIWIQSPPRQPGKIWPSFYTVPENKAVVVVVQPELIADLSADPQSQLNLVYFCRMALSPQPAVLPDLSPNHEPESL
jgi:hypothetical protein